MDNPTMRDATLYNVSFNHRYFDRDTQDGDMHLLVCHNIVVAASKEHGALIGVLLTEVIRTLLKEHEVVTVVKDIEMVVQEED